MVDVEVVRVTAVSAEESGHPVFRFRAVCSCGWQDPQRRNSYLTEPSATTSARWHGDQTGHHVAEDLTSTTV